MELKVFNIDAYEDFFYNDSNFLLSYIGIDYRPTEKKIDKLKEFLNVRQLPESLQKVYGYIQYLNIQYTYFNQNTSMLSSGNCLIPGIDDIIKGNPFSKNSNKKQPLKGFLWDDTDKEEYIARLENHIIIDYVNTKANTFTIGTINNKNELELSLCEYPDYIFPLQLNIENYVQICDEYRATEGWQYHFIDTSKLGIKEKQYLEKKRIAKISENIKKAFQTDVNIKLLPDLQFENDNYIENCLKKNYHKLVTDNFEHLKNRIDKKQGTFRLTTEALKTPKSLSVHSINKVETILGRKLSDEFLNFYLQYNGFSLQWNVKDMNIDGYYPEANFEILPFEQVFGGRNADINRHWSSKLYEGSVTMQNVMDEETLAIANECYPVLFSEFIDIVIRIPEEKPLEIYAIRKGKYTLLNIRFDALIELIINVMGINFWYTFLPEYKRLKSQEHFPEIDSFVKELFPDVKIQLP